MPKSFLDLPAELRSAIYDNTLPRDNTIYVRNGQIVIHPLLLVNRQIRYEYHALHEAQVEAAKCIKTEVINWDFRHLIFFFSTTSIHLWGKLTSLDVRLILHNPGVEFNKGLPEEVFHEWFTRFHVGPSTFTVLPMQVKPQTHIPPVEVTYNVEIEWRNYTFDSLGYLTTDIDRWFRTHHPGAMFMRNLSTTSTAAPTLIAAIQQAMATRREWLELMFYKAWFTNSEPIRWPGI